MTQFQDSSTEGSIITPGTIYNTDNIDKVSKKHHANALQKAISELDNEDATARYRVETDDNKIESAASSINENGQARHIISWAPNDPENPYNYSTARKLYVGFVIIVTVMNSTVGSALPSNAIPQISAHFNITNENQQILPISIYLVGYVLGPLLFGPLSEQYGRRLIMLTTFAGFTIFVLGAALAPTFYGFLIFRFLAGVCASSPVTVSGGVYADLYSNPVTRGRAMAFFMSATVGGPLMAPIISGYLTPEKGWRFTFWVAVWFAALTWLPLIYLPETYGPVLLKWQAQSMRSQFTSPHLLPWPLPSLSFFSRKTILNPKYKPNAYAPMELEKQGFKQLATVTLTRPIRMLFFEFIVMFTCLYLALVYAIFYIYFEAYPIIFETHYGLSPGASGLMFLPISIGSFGAVGILLWYDSFFRRSQLAGKEWSKKEESKRLPLACIGGPLYVLSLLWLGWSGNPGSGCSYWVPMLAGIPFGMGFVLIFQAQLNYITDSYTIFAASAQAAASATRSIFGACLPFAAQPMYARLGIAWASSLLAFLSLGMCIIPFAFLKYGESIRAGSRFCLLLKERKEEEERTLERQLEEISGSRNVGYDQEKA